MTTQQTSVQRPGTASGLAIAGGILMIVSGLLILVVSLVFLPAFNYFAQNGNFTTTGTTTTIFFNGAPHVFNGTFPFKGGMIPGFVSGIVGVVGSFGLV